VLNIVSINFLFMSTCFYSVKDCQSKVLVSSCFSSVEGCQCKVLIYIQLLLVIVIKVKYLFISLLLVIVIKVRYLLMYSYFYSHFRVSM